MVSDEGAKALAAAIERLAAAIERISPEGQLGGGIKVWHYGLPSQVGPVQMAPAPGMSPPWRITSAVMRGDTSATAHEPIFTCAQPTHAPYVPIKFGGDQ